MADTHLIKLTKGFVTVINAEDFERELTCYFRDGSIWAGRICDCSWHVRLYPKTNYASSQVKVNGKYRTARLHRLVTECPAHLDVDHINRCGLNNLRDNLRIVTVAENLQNKNLYANNASGVTGVTREHGKWRARKRVNGCWISLGLHDTIETAKLAIKNHRCIT